MVLGYYFNQSSNVESVGLLPKPVFESDYFNGLDIRFIENKSFGANLPLLQVHARDAGYFNFQPGVDGVLRSIPMVEMFNGNYYATLSLAIAKLALNCDDVEPDLLIDTSDKSKKLLNANIHALKLCDHEIPLDENQEALIPYAGHKGIFKYISATDVINEKVKRGDIQDSIVLIGATAPGLLDLRTSPVDAIYPGVEAHANMIGGILNGSIKSYPEFSSSIEFCLILLLGLTLSFVLPKLSPTSSTLVTVSLGTVLIFSDLYIWHYHNMVLKVAPLIISIMAIYILNMAVGFVYESRGKRQLANMFGQYVPPQLVKEMAKNPDTYNLESRNQVITVLFSDVRGFTNISEKLNPESLSDLMNEYLTPMTKLIHDSNGTIDKYMGDAIMAFWGAPVNQEDHAKLALKTALAMIKQLEYINEKFKIKGWPKIDIGIGLNTGEMTVGNMGSSFRMAYTVMGDAVNLGSRLEGLTKEYGVRIIVSEFTKNLNSDFVFRELDLVKVKGKEKPVSIFEPIDEMTGISESLQEELDKYMLGLSNYRAQNWAVAKEIFIELDASYNHKIYRIYLERINCHFDNPPSPSWDGAFIFKTK